MRAAQLGEGTLDAIEVVRVELDHTLLLLLRAVVRLDHETLGNLLEEVEVRHRPDLLGLAKLLELLLAGAARRRVAQTLLARFCLLLRLVHLLLTLGLRHLAHALVHHVALVAGRFEDRLEDRHPPFAVAPDVAVEVVVVAELIEDVHEIHRMVVLVNQHQTLDGHGLDCVLCRVPAIAHDRDNLIALFVDGADHVHGAVVEDRDTQDTWLRCGHAALDTLFERLGLQLLHLLGCERPLAVFCRLAARGIDSTVGTSGAARTCLGHHDLDALAGVWARRDGGLVLSTSRDRSRDIARRVEVVPVDFAPILKHLGEQP
mmetsp:Transcript_53699/g.138837  ORF Transcript_53699/g.138837 Transcript_53699/m.138837 type:complete len:317 (+) Transcript_53699:541-1491(+)